MLYLSEKTYPAVISVGENDYNFKFNYYSFNFGDVEMDEDTYCFYINETSANVKDIESVSITLSKAYDDYSYMVLTGDAYDNYCTNVEQAGAKNDEYIKSLLAATETKQAFKATEDNLTMTIPVTFVDGVAYFDIACEGFAGYIVDSDFDMTFTRFYILVDGAKLPGDESGVVPDNVIELPEGVEIYITVNGVSKTETDFRYSNNYGAYFVTFSGMNIADIMNKETGKLTITSFSTNLGTRFSSRNDDVVYDISGSFNVEVGPMGLGYSAYFFVQIENAGHPIVLLFDDSESLNNGGGTENPDNSGSEEPLPDEPMEEVVLISVTINGTAYNLYENTEGEIYQDEYGYYANIGTELLPTDNLEGEYLPVDEIYINGATCILDNYDPVGEFIELDENGCITQIPLMIAVYDLDNDIYAASITWDEGKVLFLIFQD